MYPFPEGSIFPPNLLRSLFKDRGRYSTLKGAPFHKHGLLRSDDAMATRTSKKKTKKKNRFRTQNNNFARVKKATTKFIFFLNLDRDPRNSTAGGLAYF